MAHIDSQRDMRAHVEAAVKRRRENFFQPSNQGSAAGSRASALGQATAWNIHDIDRREGEERIARRLVEVAAAWGSALVAVTALCAMMVAMIF